MLEEILPNLFRVTVPLPEHPLKSVNSYIIFSKERTLVIDTGWNRLECAEALLNGLDKIGATLTRTDVFLTHIHADHSGLIGLFKNKQTKIFCGQKDLDCMDHYLTTNPNHSWEPLLTLARPHGFSAYEMSTALEAYTGTKYAPHSGRNFNFIPTTDQERIVIGDYNLCCIATPGHTPGHMCLYESNNKLLFSGDHLLGGFLPTISQWDVTDQYIANYLTSLDRLSEYPVDLVLPGHWDTFRNFAGRIRDTKEYHQARQTEILELLSSGQNMNAYQIASRLTYNNRTNEWPFLSIVRKWGAASDTIAQLCYLRNQGTIQMALFEDQITWNK